MLWPATTEQVLGRAAFYTLPLCSSPHLATSGLPPTCCETGPNYLFLKGHVIPCYRVQQPTCVTR